jgi:hypothetical protein
MKKRNTPFGYCYENGVLVLNKNEVEIVRNIYDDYLKGVPLSAIAKRLNYDNIEYFEGVTGWNKSRISRILDDTRYLGNDTYEQIITHNIYEKAKNIKNAKNSQKAVDRNSPIYNLKVPVICSECSAILKRKYSSKCVNKVSWSSDVHKCHKGVKISDENLFNKITSLLNWCIKNTDEITCNEEVVIDNEIIKAENEICRILNGADIDEKQALKSIYKSAKLKYSQIGNGNFNTYRVKAVFEKSKPLSDFSIEIFRETVKTIVLHPNATVDIILKNNQKIEGVNNDC